MSVRGYILAKWVFPLMAVGVVLSELGARAYKAWPVRVEPGMGVYGWEMTESGRVEDAPTRQALAEYHADRGGQWRWVGAGGHEMALFYFEWDELTAAPQMAIDGHQAELCNVAAGARVEGKLAPRRWRGAGGEELWFEVVHFRTPEGRSVFSFKNAWLSATGNRDVLRREVWRHVELSFARRREAARVLQVGVFSAMDEEEAWRRCREEVLEKLHWRK